MQENLDINDFPKLVRDYARYKSVIAGSSEKTVSEYLMDLRTFFRYLKSKSDGTPLDTESVTEVGISDLNDEFVLSVTSADILDFLFYTDSVRDNQWSAKARKLSAIKGFYKFLVQKQRLLEVNPAADIESPKRKQQLPKFLTLEESIALLDAVKNDAESKSRERDYAIITLFLNCGIRLSELCSIKLSDIDRDLKSMRVIGKGSKERVVYLNDACRDAIVAYLRQRVSDQLHKPKDNCLFLSSRGQGISPKTVQFIVYKYLAAAGLEYKHCSVHKLRHTAATLMYQSGEVDVRVLKDILGHEQLNTTQIYTHVSDAGMESAMRHNPLSEMKPPKSAPETAKKEPSESDG